MQFVGIWVSILAQTRRRGADSGSFFGADMSLNGKAPICLLTFITFDGGFRFQPSKGHFPLKFYAPSYCIIKNRKKDGFQKFLFEDGVQNFFFWNRRDRKKIFFQDGVKIFFQRWSPKKFFFFF